VKLFITASPSTRVERRAGERGADDSQVGQALYERDARDAEVNPFEPAEGATIVDTSRRSVGETLEVALAIVRAQVPEWFT
jgi:cytidylate kinase